jgi:hypothetical protein
VTSTIYAMSAAAAVVVAAMGGQMMPANTAEAPCARLWLRSSLLA